MHSIRNDNRRTRVVSLLCVMSLQAGLVLGCAEEPVTEPEAATPVNVTSPDSDATQEDEPAEGETIQVLGIWGGDELESFEAMIAPWEEETGNDVQFTGTRDITAELTVRTQGDNPPDVAIPAEVGLFNDFAADGQLVGLDACEGLAETVASEYPEAFQQLGTVDGTLYGYFMKADTKATIWHDPQLFQENNWPTLAADSSWDDLIALSDAILAAGTPPWSMGLESAGSSGWPGSDWIQQILLNDAGPETYDGVVDGSVPYTDPAVLTAWERFGQIALTEGYVSQGSTEAVLATNFQDATYPPFRSPPEAGMTYLGGFAAGFIGDQFPDAEPAVDYDFMTFPGGAVTGGANIVYAFDDSPATCSLLSYLASAEAQQIWVDRGGFTSVNGNVSLDAYPDPVARRLAEQLLEAEAFRFDLDDAIGGAFQQAVFEGVTQYLQSPDQLETILENIEAARQG